MKEIDEERRLLVQSCLDYATPRTREVVEKYLEVGPTKAALELQLNKRTVFRAVEGLIKKAERKGFSPAYGVNDKPLPDFAYKRISTMRGPEGEIKLQWQIQEKDKDQEWLAMAGAVDRMCAGIRPITPIDIAPSVDTNFNDNLLCQYTITDYHLGMLAWHREGGDNWDVAIGRDTLRAVFKYLIEKSPNAKTGMFCNIGDFMHYDGWVPVTPMSGHILDTEGRFPKIVDAAVDTMLEVIEMMLQKHEEVIVVNMQGNHDLASSYWLQKLCSVYFKNNPRVKFQEDIKIQIDRMILPYYGYQHGKVALFYHHGHKKSIKLQGRLYPAEFPEIWGATKFRYGHTGHLHKTEMFEEYGITMEMHNTMCARDAYAAHGGWFSERSANVITYHKEHGEVARDYIKPSMLNL
jgi:hypothetical protein